MEYTDLNILYLEFKNNYNNNYFFTMINEYR